MYIKYKGKLYRAVDSGVESRLRAIIKGLRGDSIKLNTDANISEVLMRLGVRMREKLKRAGVAAATSASGEVKPIGFWYSAKIQVRNGGTLRTFDEVTFELAPVTHFKLLSNVGVGILEFKIVKVMFERGA